MARIRKIREGSRLPITVSFFDDAFAVVSPSTVRYRIDCLTTGRTVLDWTTATANSTVDIVVTPAQNAILGSSREERKQLIVQANYDTDDQYVETVDWIVQNLQGVT